MFDTDAQAAPVPNQGFQLNSFLDGASWVGDHFEHNTGVCVQYTHKEAVAPRAGVEGVEYSYTPASCSYYWNDLITGEERVWTFEPDDTIDVDLLDLSASDPRGSQENCELAGQAAATVGTGRVEWSAAVTVEAVEEVIAHDGVAQFERTRV